MKNTQSTDILDVTLLITHFNRSESLARLLKAIDELNINFYEVIVCDGYSKKEHIEHIFKLQEEFKFTLKTSTSNKGLGNTINMGQDAVKSPYLLYVQEDFYPKPKFKQALIDGLEIFKNEPKWDIIRFYSFPWSPFPYLKNYKKGFSEMKFSLSPLYISHIKFYVYSDHPHLKRKSFPQKFGRYIESPKGDVTEMGMCRSFLKNKGKGLFYTEHKELFEHDNSDHEPGLFRPDKIKTKKYSDIAPLYWAYLKYKTLKETVLYILNK